MSASNCATVRQATTGSAGTTSFLPSRQRPKREGPSSLRCSFEGRSSLASLKDLILALMNAMRALPLGLIHSDFTPGNTGWRKINRELVVFDFEGVMLDARFYDAAVALGGPRPLQRGTSSNSDLLDCYLAAWLRRGGCGVTREEFRSEVAIAWLARNANLWEYFPEEIGGPSYQDRAFLGTNREERLALLHENLSRLLGVMGVAGSLVRKGGA